MKISRFSLAATLGLALIFTLSCSSDDGGGGDGDNKGKSYGPGCWGKYGTPKFCSEFKDDIATETKENCLEYEGEFKPEGCPTNWKARCIHPSIDYMVYYFYDSATADAAIKQYGTCTEK